MTEEEIKATLALCEAHAEEWNGESGDWRCRGCHRSIYLAPELEPHGLCEECLEKLIADVPRLLDECERLRSENATQKRYLDAEVEQTQRMGARNVEAMKILGGAYPDGVVERARDIVAELDALRAEVEELRAIDASNVGDMITLSDINATLRAEIERMRVWLLWTRTRLLDNGRGETSLLGIANVLAGIERCLEGEAVDAALAKEAR